MVSKNNSWEDAGSLRSKFLQEVIKPLLPNARYKYTLQAGDFNTTSNNFNGALSSDNIFKDSDYEYIGEERFIHFTSLQSLESILKSGYMRMSGLANLSDESELNFASSVFESIKNIRFNNDLINAEKKQLFCLSVCQNKIETIMNTSMWNEYANKGSGVIIDLSLSSLKSNRFSIGHIKYGEKERHRIEELRNRLISFSEKKDFAPNNAVNMISILLSFHKKSKYQSEQELRVLFADKGLEFVKTKYPTIDTTINHKNEVVSFNKIFLEGRNSFGKSNESLYPEIKINRIILGYNLTYEKKENAISHLNSLKNEYDNLNFEIYHMNEDLELFKI
jgi:hypothetical protein